MSLELTDNVRQELLRILPLSAISDSSCFIFYDNHPRDEKLIDIIICTMNKRIIEYYKRDIVCSLNLNCSAPPSAVRILRSCHNCDLFYLVEAGDEILLLSRKSNDIAVHRHIRNVDRYHYEDAACRGQACLNIFCKDDAVPIVFDENFDCLGERAMIMNGIQVADNSTMLTNLMQKLTASKYNVSCNEKTLKDLMRLRHLSSLSLYQKHRPNTTESMFKNVQMEIETENTLDLKTSAPWVKLCNQKIVIVTTLLYTSNEPLEDIQILLNEDSRVSLVYTTKLFERTVQAPYWNEIDERSIKNPTELAIVAVIDIDEIKFAITNKIEFNGVISYNKSEKEHLIPIDYVSVTGEDLLGTHNYSLTDNTMDDTSCLVLVATTFKTEMLFRHLRKDDEQPIYMPEIFSTHLHFYNINDTNNVLIYKNSPYDALNGIMLVFERNRINCDIYDVAVYTRSESQVPTLMYCVYQTVPHQIVMTTKTQKIVTADETLSKYNEPLIIEHSKVNYDAYAQSLLKQGDIIIEYLDNCAIKMSDSKDPEVKAKIGTEIDLFSQGVPAFLEFRKKLYDEAASGTQAFKIANMDLNKM